MDTRAGALGQGLGLTWRLEGSSTCSPGLEKGGRMEGVWLEALPSDRPFSHAAGRGRPARRSDGGTE